MGWYFDLKIYLENGRWIDAGLDDWLGWFKETIPEFADGVSVLKISLPIDAEEYEENQVLHFIAMRKFSPISTYGPDPKREEWKSYGESCRCCPHVRGYVKETAPDDFITDCWDYCSLCLTEQGQWGDSSFCRFSEYRRILFRNFRSDT